MCSVWTEVCLKAFMSVERTLRQQVWASKRTVNFHTHDCRGWPKSGFWHGRERALNAWPFSSRLSSYISHKDMELVPEPCPEWSVHCVKTMLHRKKARTKKFSMYIKVPNVTKRGQRPSQWRHLHTVNQKVRVPEIPECLVGIADRRMKICLAWHRLMDMNRGGGENCCRVSYTVVPPL